VELVEVYTMAGIPTVALNESCGYLDTQPPQEAKVVPSIAVGLGFGAPCPPSLVVMCWVTVPSSLQFFSPSGIAIFNGANPTNTDYVYISDSGNNVIRAMTGVCAKMCENGGVCVGTEKCLCPPGWAGADCSTPTCNTTCGAYVVGG
jgi:hypothetical protein